MAEERTFTDPQEEIAYLKTERSTVIRRLEELQAEYDEFRTSSEELEKELETELKQSNSKVNELTATNQKLESELETLRAKYDDQFKSDYRRISELEEKIKQAESCTQMLKKYIRELEQTNDDLERAKRAAYVSLDDFETRLNQAIERNAFLESELDEKEDLVVCVQRLKDETRDLKQEMAVHDMKGEDMSTAVTARLSNQATLAGSTTVNVPVAGSKSAPLKPFPSVCGVEAAQVLSPSTFTQASRISALNIVGDVLRRVSALESKLSACRTLPYGVEGEHQSLASVSAVHCT